MQLVDDLLDVARITSGHIELEREAAALGATIEQAVETEQHRVEGKRLHLVLSLGTDPITVVGDPIRLHQIFSNLLNNAWKYTPPDGSISITLGVERGEAVVKIKDSGVGIPRDKLGSVFDLFTQANPTLARPEGGLGIGLNLVKKLVELHGGRVEAHSDGPGRGAEFFVRLPVAPGAIAPSPPRSGPTEAVPQRVLVIEDNSDGREMLATLLRLAGHEVHAAGTGADGIRMALEHSPAVVLLDIGLPDVNGYEVGRELRRRLGPTVRLVALTGYGQPQDRARTEGAGFDAHVVKPVDPAKLGELLQGGVLTASEG